VPITASWGFEYESPSSLPGITLTGGPGGSSPILAVQVDAALNTVTGLIDDVVTDIGTINDDIDALELDITAGQTSITNLTNWTRTGSVNISFTAQASSTASVNFGFTFPGVPNIATNISSAAGETARWGSRAYNPTTTGFTMFVFQNQATTNTWTSIPVTWTATYRA
jgi:hypothetical protein